MVWFGTRRVRLGLSRETAKCIAWFFSQGPQGPQLHVSVSFLNQLFLGFPYFQTIKLGMSWGSFLLQVPMKTSGALSLAPKRRVPGGPLSSSESADFGSSEFGVLSAHEFRKLRTPRQKAKTLLLPPRSSMWPWVIPCASILGRNTHVPPIWMFTRGFLGFDPQPCSSDPFLPPKSHPHEVPRDPLGFFHEVPRLSLFGLPGKNRQPSNSTQEMETKVAEQAFWHEEPFGPFFWGYFDAFWLSKSETVVVSLNPPLG